MNNYKCHKIIFKFKLIYLFNNKITLYFLLSIQTSKKIALRANKINSNFCFLFKHYIIDSVGKNFLCDTKYNNYFVTLVEKPGLRDAPTLSYV